jgi:hypothetical protein
MNNNSNNKMNKREHCYKKMIPMVASRLKHPKISPIKVIENSEHIANAIYNKMGDNCLDRDVDNSLIEIISGCSIGEKRVMGFDCSKITNEGFNNKVKSSRQKLSGDKKLPIWVPIIGLVIAMILVYIYWYKMNQK